MNRDEDYAEDAFDFYTDHKGEWEYLSVEEKARWLRVGSHFARLIEDMTYDD